MKNSRQVIKITNAYKGRDVDVQIGDILRSVK